MTRYAFIGDPHVGNFSRHGGARTLGMNRRCALTLETLRNALLAAVTAKANYAVILGDLFDSMRPEPQLIDAVRQIFRAFQPELQIILLKGNHDSASDEPRDTALFACLEPHVIVVDQPRVLAQVCDPPLVLVPFRSGPVPDWLPETLELLKPPVGAILCLHAGIKDDETAPWLQSAPDAIEMRALDRLMDKHAFALAFAGNWHEHRTWDAQGIFQVGALCPTGFSNLGGDDLYGHVLIVNAKEKGSPACVEHCVVPGPRFYKIGPTEAPATCLKASRNRNYIEWKVPEERLHQAQAELAQLLEQGLVAAGSCLPDTSGMNAGLQQAAQAAKRSMGISEAVAAFLAQMQLHPLADRDSVHQRLRRYMGL